MALEELLKSHLSQSKQAELIKKLNALGITIASQLQKHIRISGKSEWTLDWIAALPHGLLR